MRRLLQVAVLQRDLRGYSIIILILIIITGGVLCCETEMRGVALRGVYRLEIADGNEAPQPTHAC